MYNEGFADEGGQGGYAGSSGGDWIGAIIGAGAGLYDSHQNRKTSKQNTDKTIAAQKAESELAYQRQVQMWGMNNAYNSPEAQMQRFTQAGLNPHLIYGQGNAGNSQSFPQYQPADLRYNYAAPKYGAAIGSILPTLMAVGTWMQNMRATEVDMNAKRTGMDKSELEQARINQLLQHLEERNPQIIRQGNQRSDLMDYQKQASDYNVNKARTSLFEMEQNFRNKYGEGLFNDMGSAWSPQGGKYSDIGGMKKLEYLQQESKNRLQGLSEEGGGYKNKLLRAQSSMTDFDITNPQALMQLVLSGVMGMAGQSIRLANRPKTKTTHETESRMSTGRVQIRRRKYER